MDKNITILIAEDERHMRLSLQLLIKKLGYSVETAVNGYEAFEMLLEHQLKNSPFDLLICDIQMPLLTGDRLIAKMKERKIGTPVLVTTGVGDKNLIIQMMQLGCRDFIEKPFDPAGIGKRIQRLIKHIKVERLERERRHFFERFGEVSRGTMHDINNVVCATMAYSEMAIYEAGEKYPKNGKLRKIHTTAERTAKMCREMLVHKPSATGSFRAKTDLTALVERVAKELSDVAVSEITVSTKMDKRPLWSIVDGWQLRHALLNLGFNALDAMPDGGAVTLTLREEVIAGEITHCIGVCDTGNGIPEDIIRNLFNEGCSTKYNGYGIGLSNVKHIVDAHEGTLSVRSKLGEGTCFHIILPPLLRRNEGSYS